MHGPWGVSVSAPSDVKVTVSPKSFTLPANGDQDLAITVDASAVPIGEVRFAKLTLTSGSHSAHFPITLVRQDAAVTFAKTCTPTTFPMKTSTNCTISLTNPSFERRMS